MKQGVSEDSGLDPGRARAKRAVTAGSLVPNKLPLNITIDPVDKNRFECSTRRQQQQKKQLTESSGRKKGLKIRCRSASMSKPLNNTSLETILARDIKLNSHSIYCSTTIAL